MGTDYDPNQQVQQARVGFYTSPVLQLVSQSASSVNIVLWHRYNGTGDLMGFFMCETLLNT